MKIQKIGYLIILSAMIMSIIQVNPTQAQEDGNTSTFGLEIGNAATVDTVDGGSNEPDNHWVHKNGLLWSEVEKTKGIYDWNVSHVQALDDYIETVSAAGMEMILVIRSTPTWAQKYPGYFCGPMHQDYIDEFAAFVAETVTRYSQPPFNVNYYEIWNEPDDIREEGKETKQYGCWAEPYDPEGNFGGSYYGQMLKQVYPVLKAASPNAQLAIGGLLLPADPEDEFWSQWKFENEQYPVGFVYANMSKFFKGILQECYGNGWTECFDLVNFHGYANYDLEYSSMIQMEIYDGDPPRWADRGGMVEGKLDYLKELMSDYDVNKPIILTEAALRGTNVLDYDKDFEAAKADYVVWLYTRNMAKGIYATTWYQLDNYGWGRSGLLDRDNQPLPAYHAYTVLTNLLDGAAYQGYVNAGEGVLGFEFGNGTRYWVLFSEDGKSKTITKPDKFLAVRDHLTGLEKSFLGDTITFNRPIYIEFENSAPVAKDDLYILNSSAPIMVRAPGVLRNDTDIDGKNNLIANVVLSPSHGNLTLNLDGSFTYTPDGTFDGQDSFTYSVSDGEASGLKDATVTILDGTWLYLPLIRR